MRNGVTLLIALTLALAPITSRAEPVNSDVTCEQRAADYAARVHDCEHVVDLADKALNKQAEYIEAQDAQNKRLQEALDYTTQQLARESAWYKRPEVVGPVAFVLGVALGAYVVNKAR